MLTLEETRETLSWFKVFSILNILPIQVDVKNGRIQKQSSKTRVFIWKILCSLGVSHWFYMFARLLQSTILEPEKYFRWDHFVLHFGFTTGYAVFYFTGFRLFIKTPEENVIIFNQLFLQSEDPVQKMIDQELEINAKSKSGNKTEYQGNEKRVNSGTGLVSSSAREPYEEIQTEVIETPSESESESEVAPRPRPLLTWPPQYSIDELLAKLIPSVLVPTGFCIVKNKNQGNEKRVKSETRLVSSSSGEPHEEIQMEVIENPTESESEPEVGPRARPLLTWPPQYSLDELLAKLFPSAAVPAAFCVVLILAIDPTRPQLLYSFLPPEWQNVSSFVLLLAVETLCIAILLFTGLFAIGTQVMFFGKCQAEFKRKSLQLRNLEEKFQSRSLGKREIRRENWILCQILKEMQELAVFIELFNRCFPFCIFSWKIYCLSVSIVWYFFVIRHFEDFPLLAGLMGYCAIATAVAYTIMYEHAFSIPGKMEELKNEFLLTAQKTTSKSGSASTANANVNTSKALQAKMKREIKRIRSVGVKVGSFHQIERESTPNFVDFVLRNVVTLLVTFPRQR